MQTSRIRLLAVSAATLALIAAGTASVAAHPGDRDEDFGFGRGGMFSERLELRGMLGGAIGGWDGLVRTETTYQTDDGLVTRRVDNGTLTATADASIAYTLATGETATVSTDDETEVIAFSTESVDFGRGFSRERMVGESIAIADIAADSQIVVWAQAQEDGSFLAQRIVVQPAAEEAEDDTTTPDDTTADDAADVAPAASPDAAASPASDA